jgi:hypothetical protein
MTASLKSELERVYGYTSAEVAFDKAIALYLNHGGTVERAHMLLDRRAQMAGKGQTICDSQQAIADSRQPIPEPGGHLTRETLTPIAPSAREPIPGSGQTALATQFGGAADQEPKPGRGGQQHAESQSTIAPAGRAAVPGGEKANPRLQSSSAVPSAAREPSEAFRQALARDRIQTNHIWLDTNKTSDGRYWSAVHPSEFPSMHRDSTVARVIETVYGPFNQKQLNMPLGELITPAMEKKIIRALERHNAA